MQYGKLLGWGIVIYSVMYLLVAGLSLYQVGPLFARIAALATLIGFASVAGHSLRRHSVWDVVPYALVWMLEVIVLDGLMSVPFTGWQLYLDLNVWIGYLLVFLVPILAVPLLRRMSAHAGV